MLADLIILLQVYNPVPTQRSEATLAGITAFFCRTTRGAARSLPRPISGPCRRALATTSRHLNVKAERLRMDEGRSG